MSPNFVVLCLTHLPHIHLPLVCLLLPSVCLLLPSGYLLLPSVCRLLPPVCLLHLLLHSLLLLHFCSISSLECLLELLFMASVISEQLLGFNFYCLSFQMKNLRFIYAQKITSSSLSWLLLSLSSPSTCSLLPYYVEHIVICIFSQS